VPLSLRGGAVTAVLERHEGLARIEVDGVSCVAYPLLTGPVALGDDVIVNTQARDLGLGSGGFDVLYANLTRGLGLPAAPGAHVMQLPYTPLQNAARHVEEYEQLDDVVLRDMPVVCCSLHSQIAPVFAALHRRRVAYVQLGGGALPVVLSDTLRVLRERSLLGLSVGVAPCFGGDIDCITPASALLHVRSRGFEVAVCAIGPGIVGTASGFGHGGLAAVSAADADPRERHRGRSHHTQRILELCLGNVHVPEDRHRKGWRRACEGLPLEHMGRGPDEDPAFFAWAYAAGRLARELVMS
jgi:hypothetical protein